MKNEHASMDIDHFSGFVSWLPIFHWTFHLYSSSLEGAQSFGDGQASFQTILA